MDIEKMLKDNHIDFEKADIANFILGFPVPESVSCYLKCMGKPIKLHETEHGSAYTTLFSVNDIKNEQYSVCNENNLLIIGFGLNGDLLTINLKNNQVGYVFHDDLLEENYNEIADIYVELPYGIDKFLELALSSKDYPIDANLGYF